VDEWAGSWKRKRKNEKSIRSIREMVLAAPKSPGPPKAKEAKDDGVITRTPEDRRSRTGPKEESTKNKKMHPEYCRIESQSRKLGAQGM